MDSGGSCTRGPKPAIKDATAQALKQALLQANKDNTHKLRRKHERRCETDATEAAPHGAPP
eukprot:11323338-Alexandrium_andersonii.AAC.1